MRLSSATIAAFLITAITSHPAYDETWGKPSRNPWGEGNVSIGFGDGLYVDNKGDFKAAQQQARKQTLAGVVYLEAVLKTEEHFKLEEGTIQVQHYYYDQKTKSNKPRFQVNILSRALTGESTSEPRATTSEQLTDAVSQLITKMGPNALAIVKEYNGLDEGVQLAFILAKLKELAPQTETTGGEGSESEIPF